LEDYLYRVQSRELDVRVKDSPLLKPDLEIHPKLVFGVWEVNAIETAKFVQESGLSSEDVASHLYPVKEFTCFIDHEKVVWNLPNNRIEFECVQQKVTGNQIAFLLRFQNHPEMKRLVLYSRGVLLIDTEQKVVLQHRGKLRP
jgi:hypothetical protein